MSPTTVIRLLLVVLFAAAFTAAQSTNATMSGIVLDPSGKAIPGADIQIVNDATGVHFPGVTNSEGIYAVPNLPPGSYRIQVSKVGFKTLIKPDIVLHTQSALALNFTLPVGATSETLTVQGGAPLLQTESASVSTVIDRQFVENLPLNGRSFNTLLQLTPGVVIAQQPAGGASGTAPGQFSIGGQRTDANNFTVDGVSANFGVSTNGLYSGESGTGSAQAFSALGGTSSLVSVEALQEFRVETSSFAPEFGKAPGGQVILTTRSGTNDFHGGVYEYFRNDVMDANDWFANHAGLPRAAERHNDFGGFLGGPILRDKTFFFFSYEGARLRLPQTGSTVVPSSDARAQASPSIAPYLTAFPVPNGAPSADDFTAPFTGSYSNQATLNATSLRIDDVIDNRFSVFARYNYAPSETVSRTPTLALNMLESGPVNTQTLTVGVNMVFGSAKANTFRANYSKQASDSIESLDSFGGATPLNPSLILGPITPATSNAAFETLDTGFYSTGPVGRNQARQLDFADDFNLGIKTHQLKMGGDYRTILLDKNPYTSGILYIADSVQDLLSTESVLLYAAARLPTDLSSNSLSLYAQDTWKAGPRLTIIYGFRWELVPAPSARNGTRLASWENVDDPSQLALAPFGTPLWKTTYGNLAPRVGVAYRLNQNGDTVLRAGWGMFYDLGVGRVADIASFFPGQAALSVPNVALPVSNVPSYLPTISTQPPYPLVEAFSPNLKLPRSFQWNVAVEKSFANLQAVTATYVAQLGRKLLREEAMYQPNANFQSDFLLTANDARSNYNALQLQYRRPLSHGLQALLSYTWSHSLDNASDDVVAGLGNTVISAAQDYASSSFDVRNSFSGALVYEPPSPIGHGILKAMARGWSLSTVVVARTGFPFNGQVLFESPDPGGVALSRPDLVVGKPLWIPNVNAGGGKSLNPAAFVVPSTPRQGTEGRNDIPGFNLTQIDLSAGRVFNITDVLKLQFRVDAFNVLNHPNFTNPVGYVEFGPTYLASQEMLNSGLGGLNPLFQEGGPRSLQLSLKLNF